MRTQLQRLDHCLNCGEAVSGNFCSQCGQENEDQTVAVKLLFADLLGELISFDSRLVRTLVPLVRKPGFLTNEYNAGRRVRYLSPFKLYLVTSLVFFLVFSYQQQSRLSTVDLNKEIDKAREIKVQDDPSSSSVSVGATGISLSSKHLPKTVEEYEASQLRLDPKHRDSRFSRFLARQTIKVMQSPKAFAQRITDNAPKAMFFLLPIFALLLTIIYLRSRRLYVEHLIFALHCHSFLYLFLAVMYLLPIGLVGTLIKLIVLPVYHLVAMRVVYRQSWPKTFIKACILGFCYFCILGFVLLATIFATLASL